MSVRMPDIIEIYPPPKNKTNNLEVGDRVRIISIIGGKETYWHNKTGTIKKFGASENYSGAGHWTGTYRIIATLIWITGRKADEEIGFDTDKLRKVGENND